LQRRSHELNMFNSCDTEGTIACQRQSQLQLRPIAVTIASCKHPVRGLTKPPSVSYVFLLERSHVSTHHVDAAHFYVSLIYGKYRYLANVHLCNIPHTFIPHFTLHSAEKIRIEFSANYPFTTFRIPYSAFRKIPLPAVYCIHAVLYTKQGAVKLSPNVNEKHAPSPSAATANTHRPSNCSNF